ncbi:MAG: STAS domain-containing protein [Planctomycetota bacterium]|jgi:ABC-type transporter Mla MlaB component|nr:STAS domain-containing protein [Planctomycetota bacterium]NRA74952.1 STAS domain-containing protein [Planctomycetota bacterium]
MSDDLVIERRGVGDRQYLEIRGTLDADRVEQLAHEGYEAICAGSSVEVRLAGVTSIDLTGALGLVALAREASDRDVAFQIEGYPARLQTLLEEQDLWSVITGEDDQP